MRSSQYVLATLKETPSEAEVISHQLMLRAGLIRKLASGLYTWLPTGLKVLKKIETIVREEMEQAGVLEILMPVVQPADLWGESGRFEQYGPELLRLKDRQRRDFVLGPTHEEVITSLMRNEIHSYKQLPINLFQIQTKFRDEIRPRFGIMRSREFTMKDAYSFHLSSDCLQATYANMHACYGRILTRLGLTYRSVLADTGSIGGDASHEFHVLASTGEDIIAYTETSDYAANIEQAICLPPCNPPAAPTLSFNKVETPNVGSIDALCHFLNVPAAQTLKTLIVEASDECDTNLVALVLRGDHELNAIKAEKHPWVATPLVLASEAMVEKALGARVGSIGPLDLPLKIVYDHAILDRSDFVIGANQNDHHYTGCNWDRDLPKPTTTFDLRTIQEGDSSPDGQGSIAFTRGIEVGHIFQLGTKYSEAMQARVLNEQGKAQTLMMGCYGLGISRLVAAAIEQNHDQNGIIWPEAIAPFDVGIVPMNMHKSPRVQVATEHLYEVLQPHLDVLYDDRKERPGIMLNDMELLGIPYLMIVGERNLDNGYIELKNRRTHEKRTMTIDQVIKFFLSSETR